MWHSISAYFCILCTYGEAYSTSSLGGVEHAFSFNFILCSELVMTVNIPVQETNATCRIVASAGNLINYTKVLLKKTFIHRNGSKATVAMLQGNDVHASPP